jgi:hypothetical protein
MLDDFGVLVARIDEHTLRMNIAVKGTLGLQVRQGRRYVMKDLPKINEELPGSISIRAHYSSGLDGGRLSVAD